MCWRPRSFGFFTAATRATEATWGRAANGSAGLAISNHSWDDPFRRIAEASRDKTYRLVTPKIGEVLFLNAEDQVFSPWWENLE